MMVVPDLATADAAKEALGLIGAALAVAISLRVIDTLREIARMQLIPMRGFVGIDGAAERDLVP